MPDPHRNQHKKSWKSGSLYDMINLYDNQVGDEADEKAACDRS